METYTFRDCTVIKLEKWFGLRRNFSNPHLDHWLQLEIALTDFERTMLGHLQTRLVRNAEAWNEQELALSVIGPLFSFVDFSQLYNFNFFSERKIEAIIPDAIIAGIDTEIKLHGEPDGLVATGYWEPETPMFAFTEYKRLLDPTGDPAGQSLAAMLVGQRLNEQEQPLYGCYVVGDAWRFLILEGKQYTISKTYLASREDIYDIFRILKGLKEIITELTIEKVGTEG